MFGGFLPIYSGMSGNFAWMAGSVKEGISGSLSLEPSALATFFWNAAAGLKNMCANFEPDC